MKNSARKKYISGALRYAFGISVFVYIALQIDFRQLDIASISWSYTALSILPLLLFIIFQGIRFNCLLANPMQFSAVLPLQFKMQFFNLILPGGLGGDAYRVLLLKHAEDTLIAVAGKSVVDRLSGFMFTTIMFVWALPAALAQIDAGRGMLLAAWIVVVICLLFGIFGLSQFWRGLELLKKASLLITYSFISWLAQICRLGLLCMAIGVNFSVQELAFLLGILQLASLLPVSVGGLGVVEGAFVFAAGMIGVASPLAALGAVLMRLTTILSGLIGFAIWLKGRST